MGEDVEILDGLGVLALGQGVAAPPGKDVLVPLGETQRPGEKQKRYCQKRFFH